VRLLQRLEASIEVDHNGCWLWTGAVSAKGYGRLKVGTRTVPAHRACYELLAGPIPKERPQLDHLCAVKRCVNPEHLEPVTNAENSRRRSARITHCPHGHEYTPENTIRWADGKRRCRTCDRERDRGYDEWRRAHLADRAAYLRAWRKRSR